VESALAEVCEATGIRVNEFTVAPMVSPPSGLPHHQWLIEFTTPAETLHATSLQGLDDFAGLLDQAMCKRNTYYNDLIAGKVLEALQVVPLSSGIFKQFLESTGKLGGQNKVLHVSDNREMADAILNSLQTSR
jgi:hypothetical protein